MNLQKSAEEGRRWVGALHSFYEWGSGLFSFTVPIIKCKSAKDWHCKNIFKNFRII